MRIGKWKDKIDSKKIRYPSIQILWCMVLDLHLGMVTYNFFDRGKRVLGEVNEVIPGKYLKQSLACSESIMVLWFSDTIL